MERSTKVFLASCFDLAVEATVRVPRMVRSWNGMDRRFEQAMARREPRPGNPRTGLQAAMKDAKRSLPAPLFR